MRNAANKKALLVLLVVAVLLSVVATWKVLTTQSPVVSEEKTASETPATVAATGAPVSLVIEQSKGDQ